MHFAILTGVTHFPLQNTFFRGLNNIIYESILHPYANDFFCFTEENVKTLLERFHLKNSVVILNNMKESCGGYELNGTHTFNPQLIMQKIINPDAPPSMFFRRRYPNNIH